MQSGSLDAVGAEKAARFVGLCSRHTTPLITLVDCPGFLPGVAEEAAGIIKHGACLLRAFASFDGKLITIIVGKAYGGAFIAMGSKKLVSARASRHYAWPSAQVGVMASHAAERIVGSNPIASAQDLLRSGLVDAIIEPSETRSRLMSDLLER